jgi:hypothetical protein
MLPLFVLIVSNASSSAFKFRIPFHHRFPVTASYHYKLCAQNVLHDAKRSDMVF